jgi:plasmid stability protein
MSKMIQIRNVPDDVHAQLKRRAAATGKSLSGYLLDEITEYASTPTLREWLAEAETWEPVELSETPAEAIHAERERR